MSNNKIYFDHAATTPVDPQVLAAMQPYFSEIFGNTSSLHAFGQEALQAVEKSREKIAKFLNCEPTEVIFTSGATEANNLALQGMVSEYQASKCQGKLKKPPHLIVSAIEHPAVLEVAKYLQKIGVEVSYLKPDSKGIIGVAEIESKIQDNTLLVSIMYVNNEIGTIQPIKYIGEMLTKQNKNRKQKIYFHTDAVQAANYLNLDVKQLGVDLLSFSGHKIYGPKGIGVLFVKADTPLQNIQFGGHHEKGLRPGTINSPLIVGLGQAVELISARNNDKIQELRDCVWQQIQEQIPNAQLNGSLIQRVPNNLNISFAHVEGEALLLGLSLAGIAVSTGSACSSGSLEPSQVLMSLGLTHEQAHGSLRLSFGKDNTRTEVDIFIAELKKIVDKYRNIAP